MSVSDGAFGTTTGVVGAAGVSSLESSEQPVIAKTASKLAKISNKDFFIIYPPNKKFKTI